MNEDLNDKLNADIRDLLGGMLIENLQLKAQNQAMRSDLAARANVSRSPAGAPKPNKRPDDKTS